MATSRARRASERSFWVLWARASGPEGDDLVIGQLPVWLDFAHELRVASRAGGPGHDEAQRGPRQL